MKRLIPIVLLVAAVAVYRILDGEMVITDIEIDGKPIAQFTREAK